MDGIAVPTLTYPEWQQKIRAAQSTVQEREAVLAAKRQDEERSSERSEGQQLREALAIFGIIASPSKNYYEQDRLWFELIKQKSAELVVYSKDNMKFGLHIGYVLAEEYRRFVEPWDFCDYILFDQSVTDDRTEVYAKFAEAIDDVTERAAQHMKIVDKENAKLAQPEPALSAGDQLVLLIRQLIREEINQRDCY